MCDIEASNVESGVGLYRVYSVFDPGEWPYLAAQSHPHLQDILKIHSVINRSCYEE